CRRSGSTLTPFVTERWTPVGLPGSHLRESRYERLRRSRRTMAYFHVGGGALFVGTDEGIGGLSELSGRIESGALNRTAADDRELASDLVERAGADRREAKLHIEVG